MQILFIKGYIPGDLLGLAQDLQAGIIKMDTGSYFVASPVILGELVKEVNAFSRMVKSSICYTLLSLEEI